MLKPKEGVEEIIARKAKEHGIPPEYMINLAKSESSLNPKAKSKTSSARGLYQFINSTEQDMLKRHGMEQGDIYDPEYSADLAAKFAASNAKVLKARGVPVTPVSLHLAHFAGPYGAAKVFQADPEDPAQVAFSNAQIRANPGIFKPGTTVGDVIDFFSRKQSA